jgi:inner membrane protein
MPTIMTHAAVGLGLAKIVATRPMPPLYYVLAAGLAMLPDADVLAFAAGIPYEDRFGHRGFFHSLCFAAIAGGVATALTYQNLPMRWWLLYLFFFAVTASHGILDTFTNGGLGIALLSPFDDTRYFFPWQPIQVSPIGMAFFGRWGLYVILSEFLWVWVPLGVIVGGVLIFRRSS